MVEQTRNDTQSEQPATTALEETVAGEQVPGTQGSGTEVKPKNKQKGDLTQEEQIKQKVPKSTAGTAPGDYRIGRVIKHVWRNKGKYLGSVMIGAGGGVAGTLYAQHRIDNQYAGKTLGLDHDVEGFSIEYIDVRVRPIIKFDPATKRFVLGKELRALPQSIASIIEKDPNDPNNYETLVVIDDEQNRHKSIDSVTYDRGRAPNIADPNDTGRPETIYLNGKVPLKVNIPRQPGYNAARRGGPRR